MQLIISSSHPSLSDMFKPLGWQLNFREGHLPAIFQRVLHYAVTAEAFQIFTKKKKKHVMIRYDNREKRSSRCLKWNHSFTVMFLVWFDFQTFLVLDHFIHTRLCKNKYISFIFLTHTHVSSVTGEDAHSTAAVGVTSPDKYRRTGFGQFWLPENEQAGNILGF